MNFRSMDEFWAFYVNQHSKPATRRWHFVGTLTSILCLIYSLCFNWWCVFLVPLFGYGFAWYSHFFVEGNVPATFGHPFWSLMCDFKMFGLMLTGKMDREIKRLGKRPILQEVAADQGFYSPVIDFSMGGDIGADKEFSASHGTPQSAAPTTSGKKRKRADDEISKGLTNIVKIIGDFFKDSKTSMAETAYRIGYAQDLSITGRQVKHALKALPLETGKRGSKIKQ